MNGLPQPALVEVVCPVCGASEQVAAVGSAWNDVNLPFGICCGCGLKYMNPRPSETWYDDYYKTTFWIEHTDFQKSAKVERKHRKEQRRARMLWAMIGPRVVLGPGDRVLDVGTGWGFLPRKLKDETGCAAAAVEPSDYTAEYFVRKLGIERVARSVYDPALARNCSGSFKLVTFSTSLENTYDPMRTLRIVRDLMRDDGTLFIHTPNLYFEDTIGIFHPQLFTPEALECLLARAGFEIIWLRHSPRPSDGLIELPKQAGGVTAGDSSEPINPLRIDVLGRKAAPREFSLNVSADDIIKRQHEGLALMRRHVMHVHARSRIRNRVLGPIARILGRV